MRVSAMPFSKSQIDRLGDRLRAGRQTESDLRLLGEYRQSFLESLESVVEAIHEIGRECTTRRKTNRSIIDKLRRESTLRLSQMQDIVGCRIVVDFVFEQDFDVADLQMRFPDAIVDDRRENPVHGYRAVHLIPRMSGKDVEIQIRTELQDLWAQLSEKSSDVLDPEIKYGGGFSVWRDFLNETSASVAEQESNEVQIVEFFVEMKRMKQEIEDIDTAFTKKFEGRDIDEEWKDAQQALQIRKREVLRLEELGKQAINNVLRTRVKHVMQLKREISWFEAPEEESK